MIEAEIKKNQKPNIKNLLSYGFKAMGNSYVYHTNIADGQMSLCVLIDSSSKLYTEIIDKDSAEEYVLHRVLDAQGSFVGKIKAEYESVLDDIFSSCFDSEVFKCRQTKEVIAYIRAAYADEPEYLWQKFPDNAIVRRKDNKKWYAAILTVCRKKLGLNSDEFVEILDLRLKTAEMENIVDNIRYFPGYHMNKKHWVTVCLDETLSDDEIFARIDESYELAKK